MSEMITNTAEFRVSILQHRNKFDYTVRFGTPNETVESGVMTKEKAEKLYTYICNKIVCDTVGMIISTTKKHGGEQI